MRCSLSQYDMSSKGISPPYHWSNWKCPMTLLTIHSPAKSPCWVCRFSITKKTKKIPGKAGLRFYKNVGLGFKTPKEAIEGSFLFLQVPNLWPEIHHWLQNALYFQKQSSRSILSKQEAADVHLQNQAKKQAVRACLDCTICLNQLCRFGCHVMKSMTFLPSV